MKVSNEKQEPVSRLGQKASLEITEDGVAVDIAADSSTMAFFAGRIIDLIAKETNKSEEVIAASILAANKAADKHD